MNEAFCNASYMAKQTTFYTTTHTSWLKEVFIFVFALSLYLSLCLNKCFSFCLNFLYILHNSSHNPAEKCQRHSNLTGGQRHLDKTLIQVFASLTLLAKLPGSTTIHHRQESQTYEHHQEHAHPTSCRGMTNSPVNYALSSVHYYEGVGEIPPLMSTQFAQICPSCQATLPS